MTVDRRTLNRITRMTLLPVLLLVLSIAGPATAQTCGDLDNSGGPDITDEQIFIDHLYLTLTPLAYPERADMDGVPGVTNNDRLTLWENQWWGLTPLDCSTTPDSSFQPSLDTIEIRNTIVPAWADQWVVEVWQKAHEDYLMMTLPLAFGCATSPVSLDSVWTNDSVSATTGAVPDRCLIMPGFGHLYHTGGEKLLARLYFTLNPESFEQHILIDTSDYPPSHTTVLSRLGVHGRAIDGFVPVMVGLSDLEPCGDLDASGLVDLEDIAYMSAYLYFGGGAPVNPDRADLDGVPGITVNDFQTLVDNQYISLAPLNCDVTSDSTFPVSADVVEFRNITVPPLAAEWVAEVWLDATSEYIDIAVPFSYGCSTSPITLDSIVMDNDARPPFDAPGQKGLVTFAEEGGFHLLGEQRLARLFFTIAPAGFPQVIEVDTSHFPPSHTTVLSRAGVGPRAVDGFVPIVQIEEPDTAHVCGDVDLSGSVDIGDLTAMTDYLYISRTPYPAPLWVGDMDGVPGVTSNDFQTLVDNRYVSQASLGCDVTLDSSFQTSFDTVDFRFATVPPGYSEWEVEVWFKAVEEYYDVTAPFNFDCATSSILLDSIVRAGGGYMPIDTAGQRGLVSLAAGITHPPGEELVATLYFSVTAESFDQTIIIDTCGFPPSHTTVVSRPGVGDRAVDGFVPVVVTPSGPDFCLADGDVNDNGSIDIGDATTLIGYIYQGGAAPDPLYRADVTGDCIIDSLDIVALTCALFGGCPPPSFPVATCCAPRVFAVGDTALAIGDAEVSYVEDTMIVTMETEDGSGGVRIYGGETQSRGIKVGLTNADMSIADVGLEFTINGYVEGTEKMPQGTMQVMASVGIYNNGSGSLEVFGDYSPVGDPNVLVEVYYSGVGMTGSASVPGGGLIAFGNEYNGGGLPSVLSASFQTAAPPAFAAKLSAVTEFTLVGGPVLLGDSIRLVGANAGTISSCATFDMNGINMAFLGLVNIKTNACCRGLTGNVDCDNFDVIDITDVSVLVDNQFLSLTPLCCPREANFNYPGSGHTTTDNVVDITDLSIMIDNQFLTLTPLPDCP